ncbi:MAG: ABC transporter permease [Chloroflexi bacterium]|nr:ABC transporter permease [Chloroflexota bacterium]
MLRYLLRRALLLVPVLFGVSLLTFVLIRLVPGDPVAIMLQGEGTSAADLQRLRAEWGLDAPLPAQYVSYMTHLLTGDFGRSFMLQQPVLPVILDALPATIELAVCSLLIALVIALPIGVLAAIHHHGPIDRLGLLLAVLGVSMPGFWIGILLVLMFSVTLNWLPASGRIDYNADLQPVTGFYLLDSVLTANGDALQDTLAHLIMPALVLGTSLAAVTTRMMRSSMLEVTRQEYITCARSKGLAERVVILRHMLRNALLSVVTVVGIQAGTLLGGAVVIETIFAWPGIGRLTVQAIGARDYFLLEGIVLCFALTRIVFNVLTDVVYHVLDPRIRFS